MQINKIITFNITLNVGVSIMHIKLKFVNNFVDYHITIINK